MWKTESSLSVLLLILNFLPLANELLCALSLIHGIVEIFHQHPEVGVPTLKLSFPFDTAPKSVSSFQISLLLLLKQKPYLFLQMQEWFNLCLLYASLLYLLNANSWVFFLLLFLFYFYFTTEAFPGPASSFAPLQPVMPV